jgi:hypothetical protein
MNEYKSPSSGVAGKGLPCWAGLVWVLCAAWACSGPQIEAPPPEPTPLFELAAGSVSPVSGGASGTDSADFAAGADQSAEAVSPTECRQPTSPERATLSVGQTRGAPPALAITFEGEVNAQGAERLASLSLAAAGVQESWVPPAGGGSAYALVAGYCVRVVEHAPGRVLVEWFAPPAG